MRRLGGIVGRTVGSLALALLLLGLPILVLQAPFATRALVTRYHDASAGLPLPTALSTAEKVRAYTTDPDAAPLPVTVDGRPGFDAAASSHLRDVRGVLIAERGAVLTCAALLAGMLAFALPARRTRAIAFVLRAGAVGVLVSAALAAIAGTLDFESFFAAFHGLFFAAGTWTFEPGTLLIQLFPEPLWAAFGLLWALGVLAGAVVALVAAPAVGRAGRSHG